MASTIGHDEGRREDDKGLSVKKITGGIYHNTVTYCIFHHEILTGAILNTASFPKTGRLHHLERATFIFPQGEGSPLLEGRVVTHFATGHGSAERAGHEVLGWHAGQRQPRLGHETETAVEAGIPSTTQPAAPSP